MQAMLAHASTNAGIVKRMPQSVVQINVGSFDILTKVRSGQMVSKCVKILTPMVARFFLVQFTNTKLPQNIPNGHKIYQMSIKWTKCP
jgi:hypothetical protein